MKQTPAMHGHFGQKPKPQNRNTEIIMLNPDDFEKAIQAIDALGATPAVLVKLAKLTKDPETDLAMIDALLRNDGPLAADIIRISNSPYYAPATLHSNLASACGKLQRWSI
jgi:HD-like signal output (HDOD) protein